MPRSNPESIEQQKVVSYLLALIEQGIDIKFSSIPNSTYTRSWNQKRKNKLEGLNSGLPDLYINYQGVGFWIEMKAKDGVVTDNQKAWIKHINKDEYKAFIAYSFEEAKIIIDDVIKGTRMYENVGGKGYQRLMKIIQL